MTDQTCAERVKENLQSRLDDLHILWDLYCNDPEESNNDLGNMYEYGLSFDYVTPELDNDGEENKEGYFRYQLSWGGPSDEFRIFAQKVNDYSFAVYRIEYWFLDWFDGASLRLFNEDRDLLKEIFNSFFVESGTANLEYEKAIEEVEY